MAKIVVDPGVYLPSNPDGVVVDIDKLSGRPLQSHAKVVTLLLIARSGLIDVQAPFMATFKIRKEAISFTADPETVLGETNEGDATTTEYETWQAAIFKVGDDCRQDVLALQIIAMFKNIFEMIGLPLYLYPYRVTATGPGVYTRPSSLLLQSSSDV
jgi:phosphatidylinositol 4-kinase